MIGSRMLDGYYQAALPKQVDSFVNQEEKLKQAAGVYVDVKQAIATWLAPLSIRAAAGLRVGRATIARDASGL